MTFKYNNVYLNETSLVAGPLEIKGPLVKFYDKKYSDYYMGEKTIELAEVKMQNDSINILLNKLGKKSTDINLFIGGDLLDQICATNYAVSKYKRPFLGLYSACATSMESIIVASSLIDSKKINNAICVTSSHNLTSETQFRNPIEYGSPSPKTKTFTSTGAVSVFLSNSKSDIKITSSTIGKVIDLNQKDVNNMGAVMAPAAADTIYNHLLNLNEKINDYDLILTGDLGTYGKAILKDLMKHEYKIDLSKNYNDCGCLLYDMRKQKEITSGGSGPVCSALVNFGYIYKMMKIKKYKKVLFVTTGALFSKTFAFQKQNLLGIAHAVSMEVEQ